MLPQILDPIDLFALMQRFGDRRWNGVAASEIRVQISLQKDRIAALEQHIQQETADIATAKGIIGGLLFALGELEITP